MSKKKDVSKRATRKETLKVPCPTCGAKVGEQCEQSTAEPRRDPHLARRRIASGLAEKDA